MNQFEIGIRIIWVLIALFVLSGFTLQRISSDLRKIVKFIEERESETKKTTSPIFQNSFSKQREAQIINSFNENSIEVRVATNETGLRIYYLSDIDEGKKQITWDELIVHYTNAEWHV